MNDVFHQLTKMSTCCH